MLQVHGRPMQCHLLLCFCMHCLHALQSLISIALSTPPAPALRSAGLGHGASKRPNGNLSHNEPATSMLQREKHSRTPEIELADMKPTTSIRSASNVASLCVFLYRDRKTKKGPTRILPSRGKRLWRYTRTCVAANRNACGQEF